MTAVSSKSLDQLERETEQNRAALVGTVDALRETILGEVEDMRRKVSIDYVKSEIGAYARSTGSAWYDGVRRSVRDNPLRSVAIGAGLSVPLWKMGRSVPMPLLLIGAGVALARPATRDALTGAAANVKMAGDRSIGMAGETAGGAWDGVKATGAQVGQQVASGLDTARQTVRSMAQDAASRVSGVVNAGTETASGLVGRGTALAQGGADTVVDARDHAGRTTARAGSAATDLFHRNPLLVAGAGLAIGALIAAIMPTTEVEGQLLDKVAPDLKQKATDLIDQGYGAARVAAGDLVDGAVSRAKDHGLSPEGAEGAASKLGEKLGAVVDAALDRTGDDHTGATRT